MTASSSDETLKYLTSCKLMIIKKNSADRNIGVFYR